MNERAPAGPGPWGHHCVWEACGHEAYILGFDHDLWHPHYCPICEPGRRALGCDVEYLDAH